MEPENIISPDTSMQQPAPVRRKSPLRMAMIAIAVIAVIAVIPFFAHTARGTAIVIVTNDPESSLDSLSQAEGELFCKLVKTTMSMLGTDPADRAGAYMVEEGETPIGVARKIRNRQQISILFTFNNIRTKDEFIESACRKFMFGVNGKEQLKHDLSDSTFCAAYGKTPETIISIFLPDSYQFYYTVDEEDFIKRLAGYYEKFWNDERKSKAAALGLTPDQVSIIASIVEEETAKKNERGKVARLYMNRFKKGMKLQADPTVKFAIGDFSIRRITNKMLRTESPYNTYLNEGLPPGPIRIPEKSTIDAVLDAPQHNYLYMCAKEDFSGYHNFTSSYAEHMANAAKYQAELNKRNIKS